ncbi:MAG TPA: VIT domain-containing protein [Pyrinomonadaceae bacterium]|jgi:Ca-activated chloride channel family protein|nr:VIT domain-containing protein [Pyrinomonadaceae bacterium]
MRQNRTAARLALQLLIVLAASASAARAQGVIVPRPCRPETDCTRRPPLPRALPIKSIKIDTKIARQVATTHVEQVFRNDTDAVLEGTYFFPVPESASVSEFAIWDGNRRLVGEVRSREEARRIYDEIVRRQRDPGLLEYAGKDLFQASIFPIPAHADKKLELTYTQVLRAESGTVSYRYPLGTGHNLTTIGQVSGSVEIEGREPIRNVYSPSHAVDVTRRGDERRARVSFESAAGREPQDFQLFYSLSGEDFGMSLLTHREPGRDGYFLLMISPKDNWAEAEYAAKDIVFVLDTSGSMAEAGKMEKARAALLFGIRTLREGDRFNVVSFAGEERLMEGGLVQADARGRQRGAEFVESLRANGGTNINGALLAALRQFDGGANDRPKMLVFLTDGLPTVGETNAQRIVENASGQRREGVRLFTFGVGYDVNTVLLDKLAAENGGTSDYVEPKEDLEIKVSNFFAKVNYPVLTDLGLDWGGVDADLVYPRQTPDLFRGSQVTLIGRYRNASDLRNVRLRLSGKTGREARSFAYENLRFPMNSDDNDFLPRLWATRRVGWLMEQVRTNGEQKELRDEIVDLGTRYGIVTPYTSYLALESNLSAVDAMRIAPGGGAGRREARRGGAVTGLSNRQVADLNAPPPAPMPTPMPVQQSANAPKAAPKVSGAGAVQESVSVTKMKDAERADTQGRSSAVRNVGGKTFYLREGEVWTDAEFKADAKLAETSVAFGGEAYFDLLKREPKLADYFALGERVVVVFKGRVYRVTSK